VIFNRTVAITAGSYFFRAVVPNMVNRFPVIAHIAVAASPAGLGSIALLGTSQHGHLLRVSVPQRVYVIAVMRLAAVDTGISGMAHFQNKSAG